jgi:hypothetical protein
MQIKKSFVKNSFISFCLKALQGRDNTISGLDCGITGYLAHYKGHTVRCREIRLGFHLYIPASPRLLCVLCKCVF